MSTVLAIETSCDETSVAIVAGGSQVLANVVSSQIELHAEFGGVVPEIASRLHLQLLEPVLSEAFFLSGLKKEDISAVAATQGPGLIGALLVGVSAAKALSLAWDVPYVGVNHVEGHLFATFLENPELKPPMVVLLVAGGHTQIVKLSELGEYKILGSTIDDAAGEAFDKVARYLGLGYPGGPIIDRLSQGGDPTAIRFPRGMMDNSFDFSFSGMKTAAVNYVRSHPDANDADIAASFQEAVVDVLVTKTIAAAKANHIDTICLGGGVSANSRLREVMSERSKQSGIKCYLPSKEYCTDNAAMIAAAADWRLKHDGPTDLSAGAYPSLPLTSA